MFWISYLAKSVPGQTDFVFDAPFIIPRPVTQSSVFVLTLVVFRVGRG